jgi:glucan phosphoethanolaminetransferase (alkaline phosphatase superfamily)
MGEEGQAINKPADEGSTATGTSNTGENVRPKTDSVINRRSRWLSSMAALRYVNSVSRDDEIKVRDSDRATAIALLVCCFAALACLLIPQLEKHRINFVVAADLLVGLALLMYVANRFGIVTTFQPRQALLTWQLMLGSSLLGIFLTINLALLLALLGQNTHLFIAH